jgi:hypothetical protein
MQIPAGTIDEGVGVGQAGFRDEMTSKVRFKHEQIHTLMQSQEVRNKIADNAAARVAKTAKHCAFLHFLLVGRPKFSIETLIAVLRAHNINLFATNKTTWIKSTNLSVQDPGHRLM